MPLLLRNSWLKLCKYITADSHLGNTQVLRFFQSHDHKVYIKRIFSRGPLWAELMWKKKNIEQHEESKNTVMPA